MCVITSRTTRRVRRRRPQAAGAQTCDLSPRGALGLRVPKGGDVRRIQRSIAAQYQAGGGCLSSRARFAIAATCFFFSGAAGLLYEVVWLRLLGLAFGHTVYATTTVLAAYMGGLALGSLLFGRHADRSGRPLRVYGLMEAGVAAWCLATPLLFSLVDSAYIALATRLQPSAPAASAIQFLFAAAVLLPP